MNRHWMKKLFASMHIAFSALRINKLRSALTMLGIIIGIASVVSVVALGEGSRRKVLADISSIGTNTIEVFSGQGFGDPRSARIQTLRPDDADALAEQSYVDSVTPNVQTSVTARVGNIDASVNVTGVGDQYFRVKGLDMALGTAFDAVGIRRYAQVAVIDDNARKRLFPDLRQSPVGQVVLLNNLPCRVIGVLEKPGTGNNNGTQGSLRRHRDRGGHGRPQRRGSPQACRHPFRRDREERGARPVRLLVVELECAEAGLGEVRIHPGDRAGASGFRSAARASARPAAPGRGARGSS